MHIISFAWHHDLSPSMTLKGHSNNKMFLSVSIFRMLQDNHTNFYFGQVPRYGQPPKPIEFEVDQAMLIRLISLMSKLLKLPIS